MEECKSVGTPFVNSKLLKLSDEESMNVQRKIEGVPYKAGVGSFMYVMVAIKIDISFAVSTVNQFMSKVSPPHWMAMKRIMRYFKGTLDFKLCLKENDTILKSFCDADKMEDANNWRSTTGYIFFVGVGVITWKCKKQPTIALSIREAEYMTTSHYTKEVVWLRQLLADVGYVQERPTSIMYDNQECTTLVKNPTHHSYTKHINVQHQFIKEKLENQDICLKYCPTEDMIADVLIKPLAKDRIKH